MAWMTFQQWKEYELTLAREIFVKTVCADGADSRFKYWTPEQCRAYALKQAAEFTSAAREKYETPPTAKVEVAGSRSIIREQTQYREGSDGLMYAESECTCSACQRVREDESVAGQRAADEAARMAYNRATNNWKQR